MEKEALPALQGSTDIGSAYVDSNKTYDNVLAVTIATPCEGKAVAKYYNGISFNEDKKCSIKFKKHKKV